MRIFRRDSSAKHRTVAAFDLRQVGIGHVAILARRHGWMLTDFRLRVSGQVVEPSTYANLLLVLVGRLANRLDPVTGRKRQDALRRHREQQQALEDARDRARRVWAGDLRP